MSEYPNEPTGDECNARSTVTFNGLKAMACWYPQMGGYAGKCVIVQDGDCVNCYVWHDGDFPFGQDDGHEPRNPVRLHHCDTDQFRRFADNIDEFAGEWVRGTVGQKKEAAE